MIIKSLIFELIYHVGKTYDLVGVEQGRQLLSKNQFGDTALNMDVQLEKSVINFLQKRHVPATIYSEEHGITEISKNPQYTIIMDGLDGSGVFLENHRGRFGTMIAIFKGNSPKLSDYICSFIIEHTNKQAIIAFKNEGSYLLKHNNIINVSTPSLRRLRDVKRIYIDRAFHINEKTFFDPLQHLNPLYLKSSAAYYIDLAIGQADLVLECTRKNSIEISVAYGLINEAGGVMVNLQGQDLGEFSYLDYLYFDDNTPVISAASLKMANELIHFLKPA